MQEQELVRATIGAIADFPKPGILFRDITPVMENPGAFAAALSGLSRLLSDTRWDKLAAIESRGFIFGAPLALQAQKPLVLLRKAGKLPGETRAVSYALEYGSATLEIHRNSLEPGDKVIIIDDLLATGGTAAASAKLVVESGAEVAAFCFLVELDALGGSRLLEPTAQVFSLVHY